MSSPNPASGPVGPDTLITVKVIIDGQNRRFKLALRDLGAHILPQKVCLTDLEAAASARHHLFQPDDTTSISCQAQANLTNSFGSSLQFHPRPMSSSIDSPTPQAPTSPST